MKHVFKRATRSMVPESIADRTDKMGFPVPLRVVRGPARGSSSTDVFSSEARPGTRLFDNAQGARRAGAARTASGARRGVCSRLELWQRAFHDREHEFKDC